MTGNTTELGKKLQLEDKFIKEIEQNNKEDEIQIRTQLFQAWKRSQEKSDTSKIYQRLKVIVYGVGKLDFVQGVNKRKNI